MVSSSRWGAANCCSPARKSQIPDGLERYLNCSHVLAVHIFDMLVWDFLLPLHGSRWVWIVHLQPLLPYKVIQNLLSRNQRNSPHILVHETFTLTTPSVPASSRHTTFLNDALTLAKSLYSSLKLRSNIIPCQAVCLFQLAQQLVLFGGKLYTLARRL